MSFNGVAQAPVLVATGVHATGGNYTVSFASTEAGNYVFDVLVCSMSEDAHISPLTVAIYQVNGQAIRNPPQPYTLQLLPGPTHPASCTADGSGIAGGIIGQLALFTVQVNCLAQAPPARVSCLSASLTRTARRSESIAHVGPRSVRQRHHDRQSHSHCAAQALNGVREHESGERDYDDLAGAV